MRSNHKRRLAQYRSKGWKNLTAEEKAKFKAYAEEERKEREAARRERKNREVMAVLAETFGRDISMAYTQYANDWRK